MSDPVRVVRLCFATAWFGLGLWTWSASDALRDQWALAWFGFMVLLGVMGTAAAWTRLGPVRVVGTCGGLCCVGACLGQFSDAHHAVFAGGWLITAISGLVILLTEILRPQPSVRH